MPDVSVTATGDGYVDGVHFYNQSSIDHLVAGDATAYTATDSGQCHLFVRFPELNVPFGATINSASVTFISRYTNDEAGTNLNLYFIDATDALAPTNTTSFATQTFTTAFVSWSSLPTWTMGQSYTTPDISSVLQEVIDRDDWESGCAVVFVAKNNGSTTTSSIRQPYSVGASSGAYAAVLNVSYTASDGEIGHVTIPAFTCTGDATSDGNTSGSGSVVVPSLEITAASQSITGVGACELPVLLAVGHTGALASCRLPALTMVGEAVCVRTGSGALVLPALTVAGFCGSVGDVSLPSPVLAATGAAGATATAALAVSPTISGAASPGNMVEGSVTMPALVCTASTVNSSIASAALLITALSLTGRAQGGAKVAADVTLSAFTCAGEGNCSRSGSGGGGFEPWDAGGRLVVSDRFSNYELRYER